jgi:hypothetical protein
VVKIGNVSCNSNFLYTDAAGRLYLGTVALCAHRNAKPGDGPSGHLAHNGCGFDSYPLGTPVALAGTAITGKLAYSSWVAMQSYGERDPIVCTDNNFALIELPGEARSVTNPSVPTLGGPLASPPGFYAPPGDAVVGYASGPAHAGLAAPMDGTIIGQTEDGWAHLVYTAPPPLPGDSGSGYLDSRGYAVGALANLTTDPPAANTVSDLGLALAYAHKHGGLTGLRLVPGTEPFHRPGG